MLLLAADDDSPAELVLLWPQLMAVATDTVDSLLWSGSGKADPMCVMLGCELHLIMRAGLHFAFLDPLNCLLPCRALQPIADE